MNTDRGRRRPFATQNVLPGHLGEVYSLKYSPDGKVLASAGEDRSVRLWDTETNEEIATFVEHKDTVTGVAFFPDGKRFASVSLDGTVRWWSVSGEQEQGVLAKRQSPLRSIDISPDGKMLAVGSAMRASRRFVRFMDSKTGKTLKPDWRPGVFNELRSVVFSPNSKLLLNGGLGKSSELWDVANYQRVDNFAVAYSEYCVAFSPNGQFMAEYSELIDDGLLIRDVASGQMCGAGEKEESSRRRESRSYSARRSTNQNLGYRLFAEGIVGSKWR